MNCWEWRKMRNIEDVDAQWRAAENHETLTEPHT
jgi:hypothetical protein